MQKPVDMPLLTPREAAKLLNLPTKHSTKNDRPKRIAGLQNRQTLAYPSARSY